jgi:hypothetical protein
VAGHELLMLCGYPGEASYFSRFTGDAVLHSPAIPYTARETALRSICRQNLTQTAQFNGTVIVHYLRKQPLAISRSN